MIISLISVISISKERVKRDVKSPDKALACPTESSPDILTGYRNGSNRKENITVCGH
jgi:hypothetical protein